MCVCVSLSLSLSLQLHTSRLTWGVQMEEVRAKVVTLEKLVEEKTALVGEAEEEKVHPTER